MEIQKQIKEVNKMDKQTEAKPAAFLLIKTDLNAFKVLGSVKQSGLVKSGKMFRSVDAFLRGLTLEVFVGTSYARFVERREHFLREEFLTQKTTAVIRLTELVKKHLRNQ